MSSSPGEDSSDAVADIIGSSTHVPLTLKALANDPARLDPIEAHTPADQSFLAFISNEVVSMVTAVSRPWRRTVRDLTLYQNFLVTLSSKTFAPKKYSSGFDRIQDYLFILENHFDNPALCDLGLMIQVVFECAVISVRIPDFDATKMLVVYAFAHFLLPIDGKPSIISRDIDVKLKNRIFELLGALCEHPANTPDVRGAYFLLAIYSLLHLKMSNFLRAKQVNEFFFTHMQVKSQNEKIKDKLLSVFSLIGRSDPDRYEDPKDNHVIVRQSQKALVVSCPYISDDLTVIWAQHMAFLIEMWRARRIKAFDLPWMKSEAQDLLPPGKPNIQPCRQSAYPTLRQILNL
jgi:hypothetical protein